MKDIFAKAKDVVEGTHLAMAAVNRTYYNDFEGKADAHEEISDYLFGEAGGVY
jgi:RecA-family ATPase